MSSSTRNKRHCSAHDSHKNAACLTMKPRSSLLTLALIRADMMDISPIPAMLPASKTDKAPPELHSPDLPVFADKICTPLGDRRLYSPDQMAPISRWKSSISFWASPYFFDISSYLVSHWSRSFSRACTLRSKCPALTSVCRSLREISSDSAGCAFHRVRLHRNSDRVRCFEGEKAVCGEVVDVLLVSLTERLVGLLGLLLEEL